MAVHVTRRTLTPGGTRLTVTVRRALPRVLPPSASARAETVPPRRDERPAPYGCVAPVAFPLRLQLLGRPNVNNAVLAATAGLCLGAPVEAVQEALAALPPPRRRMQLIHRGRFTVLDDTVGHPDSISAVFEVAEQLPHRRLHVVYAVRGQRGPEINRRDAEAVAIWARRVGLDGLVTTESVETTDEANRVAPDERDAFLRALADYSVTAAHASRLDNAVTGMLERAGGGDLVLLLGAQGMDAGAGIVRRWLARGGVRE